MDNKKQTRLIGWAIGLATTLIYRLTLSPTVSFWDCGEFISTSYTFGIGHPPGAPLYQILAHLFCLIASTPDRIAFWSNMLSAVSAGATAMFLYWTVVHLLQQLSDSNSKHHRINIAAITGSLCYAFCDTAWFSAVESEVYSFSMLLSSLILWATVRWVEDEKANTIGRARWLALVALLAGMSFCVHEMSWLTLPAVFLIVILTRWKKWKQRELKVSDSVKTLILCLFLFFVGLTPYTIIPLRAQANPTINNSNPVTKEAFVNYLKRTQYEKGPLLYPRIWRNRPPDAKNHSAWSGFHGKETLPDGTVAYKPNALDNAQFFFSYQLGYMYFRYLLHNFTGRQYWQLLWLPLLLAILGVGFQGQQQKKWFWTIFTLFFFSGIGLAIYLNMPVYQPRERDYAFVLSFYAVAIWIGFGAYYLTERIESKSSNTRLSYLLLIVPALMLGMNYHHNDRSKNYAAYDTASNILNSCEPNAILFTVGDNDTFPLWYMQEVEGIRTDVRLINLSLLTTRWYAAQKAPECRNAKGEQLRGSSAFLNIIERESETRPIYFSHYAEKDYGKYFPHQLQLTGVAFKLCEPSTNTIDIEEAYNHVVKSLRWRTPKSTYCDITAQRFHNRYLLDLTRIAEALEAQDDHQRAAEVRQFIM